MGSLQKVRSKADARNRSRFAETTLMDRIRTALAAGTHAVQAWAPHLDPWCLAHVNIDSWV